MTGLLVEDTVVTVVVEVTVAVEVVIWVVTAGRFTDDDVVAAGEFCMDVRMLVNVIVEVCVVVVAVALVRSIK